jgi:hypothetical protein
LPFSLSFLKALGFLLGLFEPVFIVKRPSKGLDAFALLNEGIFILLICWSPLKLTENLFLMLLNKLYYLLIFKIRILEVHHIRIQGWVKKHMPSYWIIIIRVA